MEFRFSQNLSISLLDFSSDSVCILNTEGTILFTNQTWNSEFGFLREELQNKNIRDFIPEKERELFLSNFERITREKTSVVFQTVLENRSKAQTTYNCSTTFESDEKLILFKVYNSDVDDQLTDNVNINKFTDDALNALSDSFFLFDPFSKKAIKWNKVFSKTTGYSDREIAQLPVPDAYYDKNDIKRIEKLTKEIILKGVATIELDLICKNGERIPVEYIVSSVKNKFGIPKYVISIGRDITERKKSELELNQLKEMLEAEKGLMDGLMDAIPDTIYFKDLDSKFVRTSSSMVSRLGAKSYDDLIGKSDFDFHSPETAQKFYDEEQRIIQTQTPQLNDIVKIEPLKGGARWVSTTKMPLYGKKGEVIGTFGFSKDVSELIESERRYQFLSEATTEAIFISEKGICIGQNKTAEKLFGYTEEEALGKAGTDWIIPKDREIVSNFMKKEHEEAYEVTALRKDGTTFPCQIQARMMEYQGKIVRMTALRDITARKKAEEALIKSEKYFGELFENAGDGITISTVEGKIIDANQKVCDIFGYSKDEYLKLQLTDTHPQKPETFNLVKNAFESLFKSGQTKFEAEFITKEKHIFYGEVSAKLVKIGDSALVFAIFRDISLRKEAEELLKQKNLELIKAKEKAEENDKLKSAFLANMSHEIRTPMNGILGFANLLKEPQLTTDEQNSYIEIIEKSGHRMLNTINDLIDISKIEANQIEVVLSDVNVNEHLEFLRSFFSLEAKSKNIDFVLSSTVPKEFEYLKTDREKLIAVLTNLIKNAIKFTKAGRISFGANVKNGFLQFFVEDTGIGIDQNHQRTIFHRFVQADLSLSKSYEGSGLGLAIAKGYVELMGGKIWLESEKGVGTTFYFTWPIAQHKTAQKKSVAEIKPQKPLNEIIGNLSILVVEDDEVAQLYLTQIFEKKCRQYTILNNGADAVEFCRQNPNINLILMDVKMPGLDGYETTRLIREFNRETIIFAQTAYAFTGEKQKALAAGCDDYIAKPVNRRELLKLLEKHF